MSTELCCLEGQLEVIDLERENKELREICAELYNDHQELETMAHYLIDQLPENKANRVVAFLKSGYDIVKSNMTLIVFLNGITMFVYGLIGLLEIL